MIIIKEVPNKPVLKEQFDDTIFPIFIIEEYEETPMHQPYPILQLNERSGEILQTKSHWVIQECIN